MGAKGHYVNESDNEDYMRGQNYNVQSPSTAQWMQAGAQFAEEQRRRGMESKELLPCPFCGGKMKKDKDFDDYKGHTKKCYFWYLEFIEEFHIYDIKSWNTRTPRQELMALDVGQIKEYFLEMLKEGEKISRLNYHYSGKRIDQEMLKYATIGARNFIAKHFKEVIL